MYSNRTFKCNCFCTIPLGTWRRLCLHAKHILILKPGKPSCMSACMCLARWFYLGILSNCALLLKHVHPCSHNFFNRFNSALQLAVFLSLQLQIQQEWSQWTPSGSITFQTLCSRIAKLVNWNFTLSAMASFAKSYMHPVWCSYTYILHLPCPPEV